MTLFDSQLREYRLFDSSRLRYIKLSRRMSEEESKSANDYFVKSLCPHLVWKPVEEVRKYTIKTADNH